MQRALSTVFLLGLLAATAGAFALTEHLKLIKSPVYKTRVTREFSPVCHCATGTATIKFSLRRADSLTVSIVDSGGHVIDTIANAQSERVGKVSFSWDGRTSSGGVAADGKYQPQVALAADHRTILMPNFIAVDTDAPQVLSVSAKGGSLTVGGHLLISYVVSEKAHAAVYLRGRRVILGRAIRPTADVKWRGTAGKKPLPPGRYVLEVGAVDVAGNETPPAQRKQVAVLIRPVPSIRVAAGASFTVRVRPGGRYRWKLGRARGTGKGPLLHLRAPSRRGRYRLVISANGNVKRLTRTRVVIVGRNK